MSEINFAGLLGIEGKLAESLNFFLNDTISILFMLFIMILIMGVIRTYLPQTKIKKYLDGKKGILGNIFASMFGAITPFCSCSSIPIFMSFLEAGVPLGVTFSFLIASPLINEYLVVIMLGFFGWKITLAYVLSGLFIGVVSGYILGKLGLEKELVHDLISKNTKDKKYIGKERLIFGFNEAISIVKKLWIWIIIGVGVGALTHNFVPSETIHSLVEATGLLGIPLVVLLGVPLYGSCAAIVPIAVVLFEKGVPLGTALSLIMAISALSFPEAVILRRVMNLKLIAIFFGVVTLGIIIIGYLFNFLTLF